MSKPIRIQGCFISTEDSMYIINQVKSQKMEEKEESELDITRPTTGKGLGGISDKREPEFPQALDVVIAEGKASASLLQRRLNIGYNKAARLMEQLEAAGAIGKQDGVKPRDVLVSSASEILGNSENNEQESF